MKKEINLVKNIILSNFKRLKKPYKLTFAVTYNCNSKCMNCNIWKKKSTNELTLNEIKKFFEKNNHFSWIDLTGGEITKRKDIVQITETIIKNCKNLYLLHYPTNAESIKKTVETTNKILALKPHKFIVSISLDGPPKTHNKIRGLKNSWKRSVNCYEELKKIKSSSFDVFFGMTISNDNYNKINETIKTIRKEVPNFKYSDLHINIIHESKHYYKNKIKGLKKESILKAVEEFKKKRGVPRNIREIMEYKYLSSVPKYLYTEKTPIICQALSASCFLDPYGNIYPCIVYYKLIENIKKINYDLKKLWQEKSIEKLRKEIIQKKCQNCWTPCEAYQSILANLKNVK